MRPDPLRALEDLRNVFHVCSGREKRSLLEALDRIRLRTAGEVERLHEALCFIRAYPDDASTLAKAGRMLRSFARRPDLRRHAGTLENSGIAGTAIRFPFFWPTARWLARKWPRRLILDRLDRAADRAIGRLFGVRSGFAAIDRIRPRGVSDATFFVRLVERMPGGSFSHEAFYDAIEPVIEVRAANGTPSRTLARHPVGPIYWQETPVARDRPDLAAELRVPPRRVRKVTSPKAARLLDLARGAMATRSRDLDAFAYGDPHDVRIVEDTRGLAFALIGMIAERRKPDADVYGAVTLHNGVPIGYMDLVIAGEQVEISFNTFSTYRDGEAARIFARTLAMARRVFGSNVFRIGPYALGDRNAEAIDSGAWWFYYKLGFRPRGATARRLARRELKRWRADRSYRSSRKALEALARWPLYYRYH